MLIDIVVLTGMLYLSAGMANPFAMFYFVNIAVAGAIIAPAWAWGIWLSTIICVMFLLLRSQPIAALSGHSLLAMSPGGTPAWTIPKIGFFASFATCSGVITYFITILTGELKQREQALKDAEDARIRNRQLEALTTLAAGAAHELASPLSTIAVVAKELSRALEKQPNVPEVVSQDVALIRSELDRCRQILDRMTSTAGDAAGEKLQTISIEAFLNETLLGLREPERVALEIAESERERSNLMPVQAAAQAIRNLLQNAIDASPPGAIVKLMALPCEQGWMISVVDRGVGMSPEILQRIGEPFFTLSLIHISEPTRPY